MRQITIVVIIVLLLSGCACLFKKPEVCNDEKYGPAAIRLSEFSSQVIYYYRAKKQVVPSDFDERQFVQILKQLPPDQVNQKDVDSMVSTFKIEAHTVDSGFSVMLCEKNGKKLMEDFASPKDMRCRFELNQVEIKSWNESTPCLFGVNWQQYCNKP